MLRRIFKYRKRFFVFALLLGLAYLGYILSLANSNDFFDVSLHKILKDTNHFGDDHVGLQSSVKDAIDLIEGRKHSENYDAEEVTEWPETVNKKHDKQYRSNEEIDQPEKLPKTTLQPKDSKPESHRDIEKKINIIHDLQKAVHDKNIHKKEETKPVTLPHEKAVHERDIHKNQKVETTALPVTTTTARIDPMSHNHTLLKHLSNLHAASIANLPDGHFHLPDEGLDETNREFCPFELLNDDHEHDYSHIKPYFDSIRRDHYGQFQGI